MDGVTALTNATHPTDETRGPPKRGLSGVAACCLRWRNGECVLLRVAHPGDFAHADYCGRKQDSSNRRHCDDVDTKVTVVAGVATHGGKQQRA